MSREKEDYRAHRESLSRRFGEVALIPLKDASEYCNIDVKVLKREKTFPLKKVGGRYYVPTESLARWLS